MTGSESTLVSVWRKYDLRFVERWGVDNISSTRQVDGSISFSGPSNRWGYIAVAPAPKVLSKPGGVRVRADIEICRGKACVGIMTPDQKGLYKQVIIDGIGSHKVEIEAECTDGPGHIVFRHGGMEEGETAFTLHSLEFLVPDGLEGDLRPSRSHHSIFERFPPWTGLSSPGLATNWLGTLTDPAYFMAKPPVAAHAPRQISPPLPGFNEEYFEWIDLLEAVAAADQNFTMVELGAGWGRWLVDGWNALRRIGKGSIPVMLVGVEAEPQHFRWMVEHFRANGLDSNRHRLLEAAVAARDGPVHFVTGHAADWYGQAIVDPRWRSPTFLDAVTLSVEAISLSHVTEGLGQIDLIDMDIQGSEAEVVQASRDLLQQRVKRVHIGTHSPEIEASLRDCFGSLGWRCLADYAMGSTSATPYGPITFGDGVQSWVNPRLGRSGRD